uniref:ABC transporter domain-containing protein n=1 Tax=Quercus lobata TaxID=97700 RepID=A0A7N2L0M7_QUELO
MMNRLSNGLHLKSFQRTYDRARKGLLHGVTRDFKEIDLKMLRIQEKRELLDRVFSNVDQNEEYLKKLKARIDGRLCGQKSFTLGLQLLFKYYRGYIADYLHLVRSRKAKFSTLSNVCRIIKPGRLALLLGPPGSKLKVKKLYSSSYFYCLCIRKVTYNGHEMHEFVPQRTSAYINQYDVHIPLLTVRETLTFSAKCQGVGTGYGLDVCADTIVGNEMIRGISGGQKKRVTTGEMLVGPSNAFFIDNISNGLDSSTTFQIINSIWQSIHIFNKSALICFLQPPPETYELFDDIILLLEGQIVTSRKDQRQYWVNEEQPYHYVSVNKFAEAFKSFHVGRSIQRELATPFNRSKSHPAILTRSKYGANMKELMKACFSREVILMKRSVSMHLFRAIQMTKTHHDTLEDGIVYLGALYFGLASIMFAARFELPQTIDKLPMFYKQRDLLFYPSRAFSLPVAILGIPLSLIDVVLWVAPTYFLIGFDPSGISGLDIFSFLQRMHKCHMHFSDAWVHFLGTMLLQTQQEALQSYAF